MEWQRKSNNRVADAALYIRRRELRNFSVPQRPAAYSTVSKPVKELKLQISHLHNISNITMMGREVYLLKIL